MRSRILVLEDDADLRDLFHLILSGAGHDVQSVDTLTAAGARMARAPRPHLLLLDLALPDADAMALCRDVKRAAPEVPIVVVTAHLPPEVRAEAVAAGCGHFLPKPFDPDAVESVVREALDAAPDGRLTASRLPRSA